MGDECAGCPGVLPVGPCTVSRLGVEQDGRQSYCANSRPRSKTASLLARAAGGTIGRKRFTTCVVTSVERPNDGSNRFQRKAGFSIKRKDRAAATAVSNNDDATKATSPSFCA